MTTICADELPHETVPARPASAPVAKPESAPRARSAVTPRGTVEPPRRPLRYEDFEQRTSGLGDLFGGRIFARRV